MANIGFWTNPKDSVSWNLRADNDGKYSIQIEAAAPAEGSVLMIQGVGKLAYSVPKTDSYESFQSTKVGEVTLKKGDKDHLTLRPVVDGWHPVNVRKVELDSAALSREERECRSPVSRILSIPLARNWTVISLTPPRRSAPLARSATNTRGLNGRAALPLFCLAPRGVCRAAPVALGAVGSYPTISPLPVPLRAIGGMLSAALSVRVPRGSRPPLS